MRSREIVLAVAALAVVVGAAACQRQPQDDDGIATAVGRLTAMTSPGSTPPSGSVEDPVRWAQCMRESGVPTDDPDPAEPEGKPVTHDEGLDPQIVRKAEQACRKFNANFGKPHPTLSSDELDVMRKWAQCMRDKGVDIPDPQPGSRGITPPSISAGASQTTVSGLDFDRAQQACRSVAPGLVGSPPPGEKK